MAACEDVTRYVVLGLVAEEPTLLQTAKAPQKEVSNRLPFEPAWRISKDFKMKGAEGR